MKINAPVKINISELKANVDPSVKVETIKADLKAEGAHVAGYRDEDGTLVMVISGDIDIETIEDVFDEDAQVDFNEFVIDDIELIDADTVEVFDNKNVKNSMKNSLSEKKKDCCPPAPKKKNVMISLAEAFQGKKVSEKKVTLDNVIDSMAGHKLTESAAINAINKAKTEVTIISWRSWAKISTNSSLNLLKQTRLLYTEMSRSTARRLKSILLMNL